MSDEALCQGFVDIEAWSKAKEVQYQAEVAGLHRVVSWEPARLLVHV